MSPQLHAANDRYETRDQEGEADRPNINNASDAEGQGENAHSSQDPACTAPQGPELAWWSADPAEA